VSTVTTLTIAAEHPALAGHFPGTPIVPGVVLLDETLRAIEKDEVTGAVRWRIGTAKFVSPVHPGEPLTLAHERLDNGSLRFSVSRAGQPVAHGVLVPL
jgi:3-hydroxymyristoyl/3-hydroxydecanoyl-(acyl carrier protein) dehydratase